MRARRESDEVRWNRHGWNSARLLRLARWNIDHFPRPLSEAVIRTGSWLAFHLLREATDALIANLRVVAPEMDERERRALALRTYRSYTSEHADLLRSLSMDQAALRSLMSPRSDFGRVHADGRGLLLVTGHLGNYELGGGLLRVLFDAPVTAVVLPERDPSVNALRHEMRATLGIQTLEIGEAVDTVLRIRRLLEQNEIVGLVADRPVGRDRVEVEFFGRLTGFLRSPALIGYLTGAPLVPSFILRQEDGRYAGFALDPIRVEQGGDRDANVKAAMQAFARALEGQVREYPHLWYQFYPYWGTAYTT
jgi:KDO2-lipid IV(A) lauroyltransferase